MVGFSTTDLAFTVAAGVVISLALGFGLWIAARLRQADRERRRAQDALRESEERLSALVASAMDPIIGVDESQRIVLFNAAAEKVFRCPAAEAVGRPLERFIPPRFRDAHREHIERFGRTGVTSRAMNALGTVSGLRGDGEEFPAEASISQAEVGGAKLYTVILRDITARLRAEEELRRFNESLERRVRERTEALDAANRELDAFAYSVSHDLRAPLRGVDGFARILKEDHSHRLDAEGNRLLEVVSSEARRMGRLIDDLLAFSRLGRKDIQPSTVDLSRLARSVFDELVAGRPPPQPRLDLGPMPDAWGDPALLRQVLQNLLGNALKFTQPRPAPIIEMGGTCDDSECTFHVRDNGVGFDDRFAHKLFGVFQRLHREEDFEGTGVGLALVQRIVQRHGGRVWAVGKVEQGATFYFTLPRPKTS